MDVISHHEIAQVDVESLNVLKRQRVILALLRRLDAPVNSTIFVKLIFLLRKESNIACKHAFYDFVPYRYGPFSFSLYRELASLHRDGYVISSGASIQLDEVTRIQSDEAISRLPEAVTEFVNQIVNTYGKMSRNALLQYVYNQYPWYATRSHLAKMILGYSPEALSVPPAIYTIGYEGRSIDNFLDRLLSTGMEQIVDVRANPVSRSYGFSKKSLSVASTRLGIGYLHIPSLGIPSSQRRGLDADISRKDLFERYKNETLLAHSHEVSGLAGVMAKKATVLLCVEANPMDCHRSTLAVALAERSGLEIRHL